MALNLIKRMKAKRSWKKTQKKQEQLQRKNIKEDLLDSLNKAKKEGKPVKVLKQVKHLNKPFYHGTTSASLIFLNKTKGRLVPYGKLEEKGTIPFSGELEMGLLNADEKKGTRRGPNYSYLSGVEAQNLNVAFRYAAPRKWTPKKERQKIKEREELKKQHPELGNYFTKLFDKKNEISRKRIEEYNKLSKRDKKLVEEQYPIIVATEGEVERLPVRSDTHDIFLPEVNLRKRRTVLFVPEDKVNETRLTLLRKGVVGAKVMPLSKLEEFKQVSEVRGEKQHGPTILEAHPQNWSYNYPKTREKKTKRNVKKETKGINKLVKKWLKKNN